MNLIFGGAYQGKLDYAHETFGSGLSACKCSADAECFDGKADILDSYHLLILAQLRKGIDRTQRGI